MHIIPLPLSNASASEIVFSLLKSHLLLAVLARRFAPRLVPGYTPQWVMHGTLGTTNGFPMQIEAR